MKKSLWLVFVLIFVCVLALSACDKGTDQPQNPNTEQSTNQPSDNNGDSTDMGNTQPPSTDNTECQHAFGEWITVKEATCKEDGEEKRICSKCSAEENKSIEKTTTHTEVIDVATVSTCKVNGKSEGKHCSVCDYVIVEQTTLPLADHTYDNDEDEKCNVCDFVRDVNCKHTETITLQAATPTCTASGLTEGKKCAKCEEVIVAQTTVGSLGHIEVTDSAVAATCTTDGKTEGKHCSRCNETLVAQTTIAALNHVEVIDSAVAATCTTDGKTEGKHCSRCNTTLVAQTTVGALGHIFDTNGECICGIKLTPTEGILYENCGTYSTVIDYIGTSSEIFISDTYEGLPVTRISENAFEQKNIKSVIIPNSITTIGKNAFLQCQSLVSVNAGGVIYIQDYAFMGCKSLTNILLSDTLTTIGRFAFSNCYSLQSVDFPSSLRKISYGAFNYCSSLRKDENGITYVGRWIIKYDNSSTTLNVPEGTIGIADYAFEGCTKLRNIVIPNSIRNIGEYAFNGCGNLKTLTLPFAGTSIDDDGNISGSVSSMIEVSTSLTAKAPLTTVILTNVYPIPQSAFRELSYLESIVIPEGVTSIGDYAFYKCKSLKNIQIPSSVSYIGDSSFEKCTTLTSINIPTNISNIGWDAFRGCDSLSYYEYDNAYYLGNNDNRYLILVKAKNTDILACEINSKTRIIHSRAFEGCNNITEIILPDPLTSIGEYSFAGCTAIKSIIISASVTSIHDCALLSCTSLESIEFKGTVDQWNAIVLGWSWKNGIISASVQCSDGTVPLE